MYGKYIIATSEALAGYDIDISKIGWCCNNKNEFLIAIKEAKIKIEKKCNIDLRKIYLDNYSLESKLNRYKNIFDLDK